jgi:sucrose phosphorylase
MVSRPGEAPLHTLARFARKHLKHAFSAVHVLPFCPYSSDDGFSVKDYRAVDPALGTWDDLLELGDDFDLMFDLVLNHASSESEWFHDYLRGIAPARDFFIEVEPDTDLSAVVRPRSLPLLTEVETPYGRRLVWTTFSADQVDLDFSNPDVLFEFIDILCMYASKGMRIVRLDAIAYLWKSLGTTCIHLPETHEIVKLLRDVLAMVAPHVLILTETNVPHQENISYFGECDEAHIVYQFSLPPLLLHALHTANADYLAAWAQSVSDPPSGCTYLNFTASHDGVGVRPLQGLVPPGEFNQLVETVRARGGHVSTKRNRDGSDSPYELNITYFDALGGSDRLQVERFICSQAIALGLKGIPALYFHSLTATPNYRAGVKRTGMPRTINRMKWRLTGLQAKLRETGSPTRRVFTELTRLLGIRSMQPAFHPDARQEVMRGDPRVFALARISEAPAQAIYCVSNVTGDRVDGLLHEVFPGQALPQDAVDLVREEPLASTSGRFALEPYQTMWITADT